MMKRLIFPLALLFALALAQSGKDLTFDPIFWAKAKPEEVKAYLEELSGGRDDVLREILKRTDRFGRTLLHYAAALNPYPEVSAYLIEKGADVNARDLLKFTPLHYAAAFNENPEVTRLLVEKGADINATDLEGRTPLHTAAINQKNPEVIAVLLELGADPKKKDIYGKTPLDYALENEHLKNTKAIELLKAALGN